MQENYEIFSRSEFGLPKWRSAYLPPASVDPPIHARYRTLFNPHFRRHVVEAKHQARAREIIVDLIKKAGDRSPVDEFSKFVYRRSCSSCRSGRAELLLINRTLRFPLQSTREAHKFSCFYCCLHLPADRFPKSDSGSPKGAKFTGKSSSLRACLWEAIFRSKAVLAVRGASKASRNILRQSS